MKNKIRDEYQVVVRASMGDASQDRAYVVSAMSAREARDKIQEMCNRAHDHFDTEHGLSVFASVVDVKKI